MTITEAIDSMLENEKDERKVKCITELGMFLAANKAEGKVDGRKLFELVEKLVKEWPEFVVMLVATSYLASVGLNNADIDPKDIGTIDLNDLMTEE